MSNSEPSLLLEFGSSSDSDAFFAIEVDEAMHTDGEGNVESTFDPAKPVYFLVQYGSDVALQRLIESAGGAAVKLDRVSRKLQVDVDFYEPDMVVSLPFLADSVRAVKWYGKSGSLSVDGKELRCSAFPCVGVVEYSFTATQCRYDFPGSVSLAVDQRYPVDVVAQIAVTEEG